MEGQGGVSNTVGQGGVSCMEGWVVFPTWRDGWCLPHGGMGGVSHTVGQGGVSRMEGQAVSPRRV